MSYKPKWSSAVGFSSCVSWVRIDVQWLINVTKKPQERVIQEECLGRSFFEEIRLKSIFAKIKGVKQKIGLKSYVLDFL